MRYGSTLLTLGLCMLGTGCLTVNNSYHEIPYETKRNTVANLQHGRIEKLARTQWQCVQLASPGVRYTADYVQGFLDGFVDVMEYGHDEKHSPVPPRTYWGPRYRTPEGSLAIEDWNAGAGHGARTALASGTPGGNAYPVVQAPAAGQDVGSADRVELPTIRNRVQGTAAPTMASGAESTAPSEPTAAAQRDLTPPSIPQEAVRFEISTGPKNSLDPFVGTPPVSELREIRRDAAPKEEQADGAARFGMLSTEDVETFEERKPPAPGLPLAPPLAILPAVQPAPLALSMLSQPAHVPVCVPAKADAVVMQEKIGVPENPQEKAPLLLQEANQVLVLTKALDEAKQPLQIINLLQPPSEVMTSPQTTDGKVGSESAQQILMFPELSDLKISGAPAVVTADP